MSEGTHRLLWQDYTGWRHSNSYAPPPEIVRVDYPSADEAQAAKRRMLADAKLNARTIVATVTPAYALKPVRRASP